MYRNPRTVPARRRTATVAAATFAMVVAGPGIANAATHVVESGETLSSIASDHGTDWRAIHDANGKIDDPNLIFPGQVLEIPGGEGGSAPAEESATTSGSAPEPAPASEPAPEPDPEPAASSADAGVWDRLAQCESNGNWSINTGNGYYGGLQFAKSSWDWVGGSGYPHEASKGEQIKRAEILLERQGWDAWPACSRQLGLR